MMSQALSLEQISQITVGINLHQQFTKLARIMYKMDVTNHGRLHMNCKKRTQAKLPLCAPLPISAQTYNPAHPRNGNHTLNSTLSLMHRYKPTSILKYYS
jgi:hypothetical protein